MTMKSVNLNFWRLSLRYILVLLCLGALCFAKDIHVASYNVENLFDGLKNGNEYKDFSPRYGWDKKMAKIKFDNTLQAIKLINADIIALQEVENKALMKSLAQKAGFRYFAFAKPFNSPIGLGVLSKYPIIQNKSIYAGIKKTRDFLHVRVDIGGKKLGIFVVHFPTQKHSNSQRLRVAKSLKKAVQNSKDKEFIMLGDFNTKLSPKSILQKTFGSLNSFGEFYDPWYELSYKDRYSQVFFGKKSALDRIIISRGLYDGEDWEYKKGTFRAVKESFLSTKHGYPNRWKKARKTRRHQGRGYSDHFPVMLVLSDDKTQISKETNIQKNAQIGKLIKVKNHTANVDNLYDMDDGQVNVELKRAVVLYKNKYGVIVSQGGRGIFIYKPKFEFKKSYMYDLLVKKLDTYKNLKEIISFKVQKEYGKVDDVSKYFLHVKGLNKARISDVLESISGVVKGHFLVGDFGEIRIFSKDKGRFKDGQKLDLKEVRINFFKGKPELFVEMRE